MEKFTRSLRRFWLLFIVGFWGHRTTEDERQRRRRKIARRSRDDAKHVEEAGRWYFKRDILDQLEDYFLCIKRLRKHDPTAFAMYSKLGAVVVNQQMATWKDPTTGFLGMPGHTRVAFGAVSLLKQDGKDIIPVVFMYFMKAKAAPANIQPSSGTIYEFTMFYRDPKRGGKLSFPAVLYISVNGDGYVRLLKTLNQTEQKIPNHQDLYVTHRTWGFPPWFVDHCCRDRNDEIIGRFLGIDPVTLEKEKQAMLDEIRRSNEA